MIARSTVAFGAVAFGAVALALTACRPTRHQATQPTITQTSPSVTPLQTTMSVGPASPTSRQTPPHSVGPTLSAKARAANLVDIRTVVPDAIIDMRYATRDNFTHVQLYPTNAPCLVHQSMVTGLRTAAKVLRRSGYLLVFWDCYRPHTVQERMWTVVPNPAWVARPGPYARSHESGRSVDVTLASASTRRLIDMGTGFDDFTPRAYAFATNALSAAEIANRSRLRHAMNDGGLAVYSGEWWHYDGPGALVPRRILDVPL